MSHDLVAVQRDAALLDALGRRTRTDTICEDPRYAADPVVGLLASLVADVDEGLVDVTGPDAAPLIPEQGRRRPLPGTVSTLPLALPPPGRRQAARAVAAAVVVAAMLSVSGVAAAVSGDPLTPYKRVIDIVRGGYDQVVPKGLVAPARTVAPPANRDATVVAITSAAAQSRSVDASHSARVADGRQFWGPHTRLGNGWNRHGSHRGSWNRGDLASRQWGTSGGHTARSGHQPDGQDGTGHSTGRIGGHDSGGSGGHSDGSGHRRR